MARKSCLIVAGLVVFVVIACILGVGGWIAWTRLVKPAIAPKTERAQSTIRETGKRSELPSIEVRVDSAGQEKAFAGWPLLVRVSLRCPLSSESQAPKPLVLSGRNGSWHDSLQLAVEDAAGKRVEWPWRQPTAERGPVTLDGRVGIEWIWWLSGAETRSIPVGKYTFKAVLDSSAVTTAEAWKGTASSQPTTLVFESPRQYLPAEEARKEILNARVDVLGGNNDAAITRLQALIRNQPKNVEALSLAASLAAEAGRLEEAQGLYGRAIDAWYESSTKPDADPVPLLRARREVRNRLLAQER